MDWGYREIGRWSANWREVINAGRKFMDSILSKSSTLVSVMRENRLTPALFDNDINISPLLDDLSQAIFQCGFITNVHEMELRPGL